ncbi:hypothetical protein P2318_02400 [Myxococcaceae bacterium GXIMD 01537]
MLLAGCGSAPRVVRLETGGGESLVFTSRPAEAGPIELHADGFKNAVAELAHGARSPARPQEAARWLFEVAPRSGTYLYDARSRLVRPLGPEEHVAEDAPQAEVELTRAYLRWCERTDRAGDCLRLLVESPAVTGDGRYALAMALAHGVVMEEMLEAFKDMADPRAMLQAVLWTWTTYMILLAVPEPFSKGLAALMTVTLIGYVGLDTFWGLIEGFKRLVDEVDRAATFNELRTAGERYGKVMGRHAARAFALLATAAVGSTAAGLGARVPKLPSAGRAAARAEAQVGVHLSAAEGVRTVAVSAEAVTISLAPGAVAMAAGGTSGGGTPRESFVIPEERAKHIFREAPGHLPDTPAHRKLLQELAADESARLGVDRFGSMWSARLNPDGTQLWVQVRHGQVINGGLNQVPRNYNSQMGLSAPVRP